MQTTAIRRPAGPVAIAATLLAALLVLFSPLSASAHDALISSSPEADSTIDTLPGEITLTFSAELITGEGATEVVVTDADGASVTDGAAVTEGSAVRQPLVAEAAAGTYHVVWKVVSSDGHPTSGEYFFSVTNSTVSTPTPTPGEAETSAAPTSAPLASAAPSPTSTPDESPASSVDASVFVIVGIVIALLAAAVVVWLIVRARRKASATDSDGSSAR